MRTAVVKFWEPATIDVSSLNRIVVLEFSGEHGTAVATSLSGKLWQNEFYTVIDRTKLSQELQLASYSPAHLGDENLHEILAPARANGIDGVVLGEVIDYRCEDKRVRRSPLAASHEESLLSPDRPDNNASTGDLRENLVRAGTVTLAFRLIDVETGDIRAAKQVSRNYVGESDIGAGKLPSQAEILDDLTQQCLQEIVSMLAPHEATTHIQLAACDVWTRGRREVKEGNRQAELGYWEMAEQHWRSALEVEPNNHAALFNLSIAADHRHDYTAAEELAMQALRLQHKTCYTEGLDKIRTHRANAERSAEQRDARVATAIDQVW